MKYFQKIIWLILIGLPSLSSANWFDASASMRIEVEVYDGPLSKTLTAQQGELSGLVKVTKETMTLMVREFHLSQCQLGCFGNDLQHNKSPSKKNCGILPTPEENKNYNGILDNAIKTNRTVPPVTASEIFSPSIIEQYAQMLPSRKKSLFKVDRELRTSNEDSAIQVCPVLNDIKLAMVDVYRLIKTIDDSNIDNSALAEKYFHKVAKLGKILTEGAEQWATAQMAILPQSKRMKIIVARASMASAELGNELSARADALLRQTASNGTTAASLLATSLYLRDSQGTDYLNLVDWMDARPRKESKWKPDDRTRMVERLISDANWSKVNFITHIA